MTDTVLAKKEWRAADLRWLCIGDADAYADSVKICIAMDPSDYKTGKKIFMEFMKRNDFWEKIPNDDNSLRSVFII
ncbi:MAG: hypothetical protein LBB09_02050 [Rickettsiales bacterium]|jgi:hypothetical protein|nr:hypothetical protein [Rickettsiales bacterium]